MSSPIASDVGHGALGLRDNLRPFSELLDETAGQRHLWVEARAKLQVTGWSAHHPDGAAVALLLQSFDGVTRDVVTVRTQWEQLVRVETVTEVETTEGTYYYAPIGTDSAVAWDDGSTLWDDGTTYDDESLVYVHLSDGRNPAEHPIFVELGFFLGSHGVWHPTLGPDLLTDGDLEEWTSASNATYWTETTVFSATISRVTDAARGTYAAKLNTTGPADIAQLQQGSVATISVVEGATYRLSGYYKTEGVSASTTHGVEVFDAGGAAVFPDGRTFGSTGTARVDLAATSGNWRRFAFDFVAPDSSIFVRFYLEDAAGSFYVDGLALQRIHRFEFYEPRLTAEIPSIESSRPDAFFGPISTSLGTLAIANGGPAGWAEQLFGTYDWLGATFLVKVGGRFSNDGNEVLVEDCLTVAQAQASEPVVTDSQVVVRLDNARSWFQGYLPRRSHGDASSSTPRRLLLGPEFDGIAPLQVATTAQGYGVYEVADCDDWPSGIKARDAAQVYVRVYLNEDAVAADLGAGVGHYLAQLSPTDGLGPDYSVDLTAGRVTILRDVQPHLWAKDNCFADFDIGGSALEVDLSANIGSCVKLVDAATAVGGAMSFAAGTSDIWIEYDDSTHKFTVKRETGTLNLLCSTGANKAQSIWATLGFDTSTDKTGALEYTADNAVFESVQRDHLIRMDAAGYADDGDGTYTGVYGAVIERAADVAHFFLRELVGLPSDLVDAASFVAGRADSSDFDSLIGFYVGADGQQVQISELIEQLETACSFELVESGGVYAWQTREAVAPSGTIELVDRDYLEFQAAQESDDHASIVRMVWGLDPATGGRLVRESSSIEARLRLGRESDREFRTAFLSTGGAAVNSRFVALETETRTARRRFRVRVKGRVLGLAVGDVLQLTRSQGLDSTGALDQLLVRIIAKRDAWAEWVTELTLIEVL